MESNIMIAPNLNGKVYREFLPRQNTINMYLDFVDIYNDQLLLGSSNLNGRYWDGSICYFENVDFDSCFNIEKVKTVECFDFGVTDGKFIPNNKKVIVCQDSGEIKLCNIENGELKLSKNNIEGHDDFITEISLWLDGNCFVTSSADASIKIWNITESGVINCLDTFNSNHSNLISSVSANLNDLNLFASCSYDKTAYLWDKRTNKTGEVLYEHEFSALTNIKWHPSKSNVISVSTSSGDVYLVDIREPKEFISKKTCLSRSIHRTQFNSNGLLAVCGDESKIVILDCSNDDMVIIYENNRHEDFVRGLAWKENTLVSCGWDKQVLFHYV